MKYRFVTIVILVIALSGCANKMAVQVVSDSLPSGIDTLVLLNSNRHDSAVRRALIGNGFIVPAVSNTGTITDGSEQNLSSRPERAAAYGIRHSGRYSANNPCITNGNALHFTEYEFELIDIESNRTLLFISKGGWTEWCTGAPTVNTTDLFDDLANELVTAIR